MEQLKGLSPRTDQIHQPFPGVPIPVINTPPKMEAVPPSSRGTIACYETQTVYEFDEEVAEWTRDWQGVAARRLTSEPTQGSTFELVDLGRRSRGHIHKVHKIRMPNRWGITLSYKEVEPNPFGVSPCIYYRETDRIFVKTLKQNKVRPSKLLRPIEMHTPTLLLDEGTAPYRETPELSAFKDCLAEIRRLEKETPYRLIRDGNDWVFQPPTIR